MKRSEYLDSKVRNDILLLDLITGEGKSDKDRGSIFDEARFILYEEIRNNRVNDSNFSYYVDLYEALSADDKPTEDDGQVLFQYNV